MTNKLDRSGKSGRPSLLMEQERDAEIVDLLLKFTPRKEMYQFFKDKYNVKNKAVDALITKGYKIIGQQYGVDKDATINLHIQFYYKIVIDEDNIDNRSKIQALQAIEKLLRLTSPETLVQQNSINLSLKDMSVNDLKELLEVNNKVV